MKRVRGRSYRRAHAKPYNLKNRSLRSRDRSFWKRIINDKLIRVKHRKRFLDDELDTTVALPEWPKEGEYVQ